MAGQDELEQVGLEVGLEEPIAQDETPIQELSPQPSPAGILGVAGAAYDNLSKFPPDFCRFRTPS